MKIENEDDVVHVTNLLYRERNSSHFHLDNSMSKYEAAQNKKIGGENEKSHVNDDM
jgi:hypothetical protein